jgi:hypothetical protein
MTRSTRAVAEPIEPPSLEEFLACCQKAFGFLVRDYGFVLLNAPREYNQFSVCFRKGELGVDVYGENWGQHASCDLLRGKDEVGLGWYLPTAARPTQKRKGPALGQLAQVELLAEVLKLNAADFLRGDLARFETVLAEWNRVTRPRPISEAQRQDRARQTAITEAGHASKRANYAEVVRLLEPHTETLSRHQRRMLDTARRMLRE